MATNSKAFERPKKHKKTSFVEMEMEEVLIPPYLSIGEPLSNSLTAKRLREIQGDNYSPYGANPDDILILLQKYQDGDVEELRAELRSVVISSFSQFLGAYQGNMGSPIPPGYFREEDEKTPWGSLYLDIQYIQWKKKKTLQKKLKKMYQAQAPFASYSDKGVELYLIIQRGELPGGLLSKEEATLWRYHAQIGYDVAKNMRYEDS